MSVTIGPEPDASNRSRPPGAPWVPPGLAALFETVLDAAQRGRLSPDERARFHDAGLDAAESGASLSGLIDAYLRGAGELWEQLFTDAAGGAPSLELGRTMRRISEEAVHALAEGFEDSQRRTIRAEENTRRELIDSVLAGSADPTWFDRRAAAVGFPVAPRYRVAVAVADTVLDDDDPVEQRLQRDLSRRHPDRRWLVAIRRGALVIIGADPPMRQLTHAADLLAPADDFVVGIGAIHDELDGVRASYDEATAALGLARAFGLGPVVAYENLLVERMLTGDASVVGELFSRIVAPLADTARGDLLATLETFIGCGGNTAEAARRLSVGTRTVGYRLDRVEAVTGYSPRVAPDRLLLELALRARPLV